MRISLNNSMRLGITVAFVMALFLLQYFPIALDALAAIGSLVLGLVCLWQVVSKHKEIKRRYVPWVIIGAVGTPFLSYSYALLFLAAWQGGVESSQAFLSFLVGLGFLIISGVGLIVAVNNEKRLRKKPQTLTANDGCVSN